MRLHYGRMLARAFRTTWCRRHLWCWTSFRSRPTASLIAERCLCRIGGRGGRRVPRARRRRRFCARYLPRFCGSRASALEAAVADVVERHESLRTIFPDTLGVPRQQILEACAALPRLQVRSATEATLAEALASAAGGGFDLDSEPPLRAQLFSLGSSEH